MIRDIKNRFGKSAKRQVLNNSIVSTLDIGNPIINKFQNEKALIKVFGSTAELYGPIVYMGVALSKVSLKMRKGSIENPGEIIDNHKIIDLLKNPNYYQSWSEFIIQYWCSRYLFGNSYLNATNNYSTSGLKPDNLFILPSQFMEIIPTGGYFDKDFRKTQIKAYHLKCSEYEFTIDPFDIMHSRSINLTFENGQYLFGKSPILANQDSLNAIKASYEAEITLLQNRGAMVAITSKDSNFPIKKGGGQDIRKEFNAAYGVGKDQIPIMITEHPIDVKEIKLNLKDLLVNENILANYNAICTALRFPSIILNDNSASAFNNVNIKTTQLWEDVLVPDYNDFANDLTNFFKRYWKEDFFLQPDYSNIGPLKKDEKTLNETLSMQLKHGIISPNEYRVSVGLEIDPDPIMDKKYILKNLTPIDNQLNNEDNAISE